MDLADLLRDLLYRLVPLLDQHLPRRRRLADVHSFVPFMNLRLHPSIAVLCACSLSFDASDKWARSCQAHLVVLQLCFEVHQLLLLLLALLLLLQQSLLLLCLVPCSRSKTCLSHRRGLPRCRMALIYTILCHSIVSPPVAWMSMATCAGCRGREAASLVCARFMIDSKSASTPCRTAYHTT